jgi:glycosyltransferase involved in cell wall biosynthesis
LLRLFHSWARHLYWPDSSFPFYWPARRKALEIARERPPTAIISVSSPFSAVVVGRAIHRSIPGSRWLIDLGDPFSIQVAAPPNNTALYGRLNRRIERAAFAEADGIALTTPETAARYAEAFPESAGKLHVIPPLLSLPEGDGGPPLFPRDDAVRLAYVGTLHRHLREPRFLLDLFRALRAYRPSVRHELHFFGDVQDFGDDLRMGGGSVHVHGMVPRETAVRALHDADVLVNIGNATADQLPSKLLDYAASGKPIVNLAVRPDDCSASLLDAYPDRLSLRDDGSGPSPEQVEALARFTASLPRTVPAKSIEAWLEPYRLPRIARQYEALLR